MKWHKEGCGARLNLPRDRDVAYTVGRMGAVTVNEIGPLYWGALSTARLGLARLVKLGILRSFDRDPSQLKWFALTRDGFAWVAEAVGAEEDELRLVTGLARTNLAALQSRNQFWSSLIRGCRGTGVKLARFAPEWELRPVKEPDVDLVPDALVVLAPRSPATTGLAGSECSGGHAWIIEQDSGSERLAVWSGKAASYRVQRARPAFYGTVMWSLLVIVPSLRRARSVARVLRDGGCALFSSFALEADLADGRAFAPVLYRAVDLAGDDADSVRGSLADSVPAALVDPQQRRPATVAVGTATESPRVPP